MTIDALQGSPEAKQRTQTISQWAKERRIQRLRTDRRLGRPDQEHVQQWSSILEQSSIAEPEIIFALLDTARAAADRSGEWHHWSFLTLQIQLAAERQPPRRAMPGILQPERPVVEEDPACDWAIAKARIRMQIGEIPFQNWFVRSRQVERTGARIIIEVPDEASRFFLDTEYGSLIRAAIADLGIHDLQWAVAAPACSDNKIVSPILAQTPCRFEERSER